MSASASEARNSSGPSKSRMRIRTEPSPCATWESEPAPPTIRYLPREADGLLVVGGDRDARVEDLDRVDVLDHGEQVLVVGHGVHAVERVRHVDEPALALDLGDRLLEAHPARDLLLDEEADHLALRRGLDLLGDDHLDAVLLRLGARVERAGDLVVVGHRDRAEALLARGGEQHVDRRGAVVGVVGVHVQVDVDQLARRQPRAHLAVGRAAGAGGRPRPRRAPRSARPRALQASSGAVAATASREPAAQVVVGQQPRQLGGQRLDVAGLEQQPELAVAQHLLVGRQPRGDRHGAGAERAHEQRRERAPGRPRRRRRCRRRPAPAPRSPPRAVTTSTRSRRRLRSALVRAPTGVKTVARQGTSSGSRRSARRNSRSAWRSSWSMNASRSSSPAAARSGVSAPARSDLVGRREGALHQLARGVERRGARVEPAEEALDEAARDLGRDRALGRRVERADVERARVAQRDRGGARRERLVHVDEVERGAAEHVVERARDVERRRRRRPAPRRARAAAARRRRARARRRRGRRSRPRGSAAATRAPAPATATARARPSGARAARAPPRATARTRRPRARPPTGAA